MTREPARILVRRRGMDAGLRRWLVPVGAALAVVLVVSVVAWAQRPGGSDGSDGGPGFGTQPAPPSASSEPGSPGQGGGTSGDPGRDDLPGGGLSPVPGPDEIPPATSGWQAVEGWFPRDETTLALNYATGVPECYGTVGEPSVEETARTVTVSLPKIAPKDDRDVACIDIALLRSVDVTLSAPLGDRVVRDGSRDGYRVPRADAPYGDGGEGEPAY